MGPTRRRALALLVALSIPGVGSAAEREEPGPAYLVYAGPYSSSPSSAFGHLFLALARRRGDPTPLWDVVTFSAVTFDADPVRYLTIGIAGGFLGRYEHVQFHEKSREYELLEDRDLWLVELELGARQREALERALAESTGRWYPYSFFQRNCAFYLEALLARATDAVPEPSGVVSPIGVFDDVLRSPLAGRSFHRPAASRRIADLSAAAAPVVVDRLREDDWVSLAADLAWIDTLDLPARRLAQELFSLRALERASQLPPDALRGLARLRVLNASALPLPLPVPVAADPPGMPGTPIVPPEFHRYPRLRLSSVGGAPGPPRVALDVRGGLHDESDPPFGHQPINSMELLSASFSSRQDRAEPRLERAVLFSQRALGASDWIRPRGSWLLELLAERGGLFDEHAMHLEARAGLGKTFRLPAEQYVYGLVTAAGIGAWDRGAALAPGAEVGLVGLPVSWGRYGVRWTREHDALAWSRWDERARAWARLDVGRRWGIVASAERIRGAERARETLGTIGVDWYP